MWNEGRERIAQYDSQTSDMLQPDEGAGQGIVQRASSAKSVQTSKGKVGRRSLCFQVDVVHTLNVSRFQEGTRNMGITVTFLASIDPHRSTQERSRLFAVSGVWLLLSWKQASTQPSLNANNTPYPLFDRSGSTFALTILCNKYVITPLAVVQTLLWS